jgi:hypothetical protein
MSVAALHRAPWYALCCGALAFIAMAAPPLWGAEREVRVFQIKTGNRSVGRYRLILIYQDDGSITVQADASVTVTYVVYTYRYRYDGIETWRGNRLIELNSSANDNGTRYKVQAAEEGDKLHVWSNNHSERIRGDAWTTTYWRLPPARFRNQQVPLLDADTGQELLGSLQFVETKAVTIAGQAVQCSHYHLTGNRPNGGAKLDVDLWYDPQERLVWEDSLEEGRRVVFELTSISH